jgi:hypothetical protein
MTEDERVEIRFKDNKLYSILYFCKDEQPDTTSRILVMLEAADEYVIRTKG